ncbi:MAG: hypothetical protein WA364_19945 [Candidatus Nitrosopolaris sp.]
MKNRAPLLLPGQFLTSHGMQGFDYEKARIDLEIPDSFDVMAMIAIGKRGPKDNLPQQLQEREYLCSREQ